MKKKSTQSRGGVKGGFPLAGSRGGAPCGVWGNAPTVPRATNFKEAAHKGAGSEASLPVTLRSRRSAPKLLYPSTQHCRARWARPNCWSFRHSCSFPKAGDFASAEATKGLSDRPLETFGLHTPLFLDFYWKAFWLQFNFIFPHVYSFAQGDNHHVRIYRRSCVRKNDQFLSS